MSFETDFMKIQMSNRFTLGLTRRVIVVLLMILIAEQVLFAIQVATFGSKLAQLEQKRLEISKVNEDISKELIQSTSLTKIQTLSDKLGFEKSTIMWYLNSVDAVAKLP